MFSSLSFVTYSGSPVLFAVIDVPAHRTLNWKLGVQIVCLTYECANMDTKIPAFMGVSKSNFGDCDLRAPDHL